MTETDVIFFLDSNHGMRSALGERREGANCSDSLGAQSKDRPRCLAKKRETERAGEREGRE